MPASLQTMLLRWVPATLLISLVNTLIYSKAPSMAKWLCLPVIVGGVVFSCLKPTEGGNICLPGVGKCYEIEFDMTALAMASLANLFAAIKGGENAKLMKTEGLKDRIGGVGNQFALTEVLGFFISLPVMFYIEGANFGKFVEMVKGDATLDGLNYNLIASGMTFYLYNELATMTIKKTGAVTASVANTAKRVIVMIVSAIAFNEVLTFEKKLGAAVAIFGVFVYSIIDDLLKKPAADKKKKKA